ncbi:MAG: RseA family anti-sigma factor [Pseudomonadota bacterium]
MTDAINMQLSAFVDGELSDAESELLIRRIGRDAELRATVAEYHAIGRIMRAEAELAGIEGLLAAIRDGIDADDTSIDVVVEDQPPRRRLSRPVAGVAIAASVALAGLVGVSQWAPSATPADITAAYTTPDPEVQEAVQVHGRTAGDFSARLISLELRQEALTVPSDESTDDVNEDDDAAIVTTDDE